MSAVDTLLSRLHRVRSNGTGKWMASCPGPNHEHGDRRPSLSIKETSDGIVLLKCWSGHCDVSDIMSAVGLSVSDLWERPTDHRRRPERRPYPAHEMLEALTVEMFVVGCAACDMANEIQLEAADQERLTLASSRFLEAVTLASGVRHGR